MHSTSACRGPWPTTCAPAAASPRRRDLVKLVLTNDDGIDAPGLAALEAAAAPLGDLVVVAPADHSSGCGHQVTTGRPFRVSGCGPGRFAVAGTPADCVRVAL